MHFEWYACLLQRKVIRPKHFMKAPILVEAYSTNSSDHVGYTVRSIAASCKTTKRTKNLPTNTLI